MSDTTRRGFVKNSAAAAAGATVVGALLAERGRRRRSGRIGTASWPTSATPHRRDLGDDRRPRGHGPRSQARRRDRARGEVRRSTRNVIASRGAGDLQGPGRRQHRRVRVRQPGRPEHGHDHRQLHPARGAGRRPELLRVRRRRPLRDPHRQRRRRRRRTSPTSSSSRPGPQPRTRSCTTPARSTRSTARTGTAGSSTR